MALEELKYSMLVEGPENGYPASRRPYRNQTKRQLPMWHRYRVELYPHFSGLTSGIRDQFGNDLPFPSAFRLSRREYRPKGIVKLEKGGESA